MNDELRLVSELSGDTYKNSIGSEISIIKIANDILMTCKEMAKFYDVSYSAVSKKLKKLFTSGDLAKKQVSSILTHKATDGKLYRTTYYNSQVIYKIGTMLKSHEHENLQKWLSLKN